MVKESSTKIVHQQGAFGGAYIAAMIGAAVYFVQHSSGFIGTILALLKALVWPGFLIYRIMELLRV